MNLIFTVLLILNYSHEMIGIETVNDEGSSRSAFSINEVDPFYVLIIKFQSVLISL